jgi:ankyrin repeat protein
MFGSTIGFIANAEESFLALDQDLRPEIFKLVDSNDLNGAKALLKKELKAASKEIECSTRQILPNGGWAPLHLAAYTGRVDFIWFLVKDCQMNPDVRAGPEGYTPLHQAISGRAVEAAEALLEMGADINLTFRGPGKRNFTALELAVEHCLVAEDPYEDDLRMIRLLLSRDADYLRNYDGNDLNIPHPIYGCQLQKWHVKIS